MSSCDCPNPPGGQINCSSGQMAICRVVNGAPVGQCLDPPNYSAFNNSSDLDLVWAWEQITGQRVPGKLNVTPSEKAILLSGEYKTAEGQTITFKLPEWMTSGS